MLLHLLADVIPKDGDPSWNDEEESAEGDLQCLRHVQPGSDRGV